jgi:pimeloyl-ACP methyl ester carboxylesterase
MRTALRLLTAGILAALTYLVVTGIRADIPVGELKERYTYPESRFMEVMGMDVHYRITGAGPETVVLLHGTSSSLHTWEGWTELLNPHFRVVSLDLPAFGLTGPFPDGDYSPENYLLFLEKVFEKLGLDSFHLAGNSFGGYLAWRYAVYNPHHVNRLVLLNASGYPRGDQPTPLGFRLAMVEPFRPVFTRFTPRWLVERTVHEVFFDTDRVTDALVDRYHALLLREGNRGALMSRIQQVKHESADDVVRVGCPTLILWGDHDRVVTPEDAPRFHRDIPGSRLIVYDRMGHVPMEEDPQRTMADVLPFLNGEIR